MAGWLVGFSQSQSRSLARVGGMVTYTGRCASEVFELFKDILKIRSAGLGFTWPYHAYFSVRYVCTLSFYEGDNSPKHVLCSCVHVCQHTQRIAQGQCSVCGTLENIMHTRLGRGSWAFMAIACHVRLMVPCQSSSIVRTYCTQYIVKLTVRYINKMYSFDAFR